LKEVVKRFRIYFSLRTLSQTAVSETVAEVEAAHVTIIDRSRAGIPENVLREQRQKTLEW
jgi:hypothetical protein